MASNSSPSGAEYVRMSYMSEYSAWIRELGKSASPSPEKIVNPFKNVIRKLATNSQLDLPTFKNAPVKLLDAPQKPCFSHRNSLESANSDKRRKPNLLKSLLCVSLCKSITKGEKSTVHTPTPRIPCNSSVVHQPGLDAYTKQAWTPSCIHGATHFDGQCVSSRTQYMAGNQRVQFLSYSSVSKMTPKLQERFLQSTTVSNACNTLASRQSDDVEWLSASRQLCRSPLATSSRLPTTPVLNAVTPVAFRHRRLSSADDDVSDCSRWDLFSPRPAVRHVAPKRHPIETKCTSELDGFKCSEGAFNNCSAPSHTTDLARARNALSPCKTATSFFRLPRSPVVTVLSQEFYSVVKKICALEKPCRKFGAEMQQVTKSPMSDTEPSDTKEKLVVMSETSEKCLETLLSNELLATGCTAASRTSRMLKDHLTPGITLMNSTPEKSTLGTDRLSMPLESSLKNLFKSDDSEESEIILGINASPGPLRSSCTSVLKQSSKSVARKRMDSPMPQRILLTTNVRQRKTRKSREVSSLNKHFSKLHISSSDFDEQSKSAIRTSKTFDNCLLKPVSRVLQENMVGQNSE